MNAGRRTGKYKGINSGTDVLWRVRGTQDGQRSGRRIKGKTPRSHSSDPASLRGEYDDSFRGFATFPPLRQTSQCLPSSTKKGRQSPLNAEEFRGISIRLQWTVTSTVMDISFITLFFFIDFPSLWKPKNSKVISDNDLHNNNGEKKEEKETEREERGKAGNNSTCVSYFILLSDVSFFHRTITQIASNINRRR